MNVLVQLTEVPQSILEYMLSKGYYKTRAEAIRAAIVSLGKEYNIFDREDFLLRNKLERLEHERKQGKIKFETLGQVKRRYKVQ